MPPSRSSSSGKMARIAASPYQPGIPGTSNDADGPVGGASQLGPPPGLGEPPGIPQIHQPPVRGASAPPDGRAQQQTTIMELDHAPHPSPHHVITGRGDIHGNEYPTGDGTNVYAQQNNAQYNDHRIQYLQQNLLVAMTSTDPAVVNEAWAAINRAHQQVMATEAAAQQYAQSLQNEAVQ